MHHVLILSRADSSDVESHWFGKGSEASEVSLRIVDPNFAESSALQ